jgi:Xaa-Pro aminopeptidase
VLSVQLACIDLVRPTSTFKQVSDAAIRGLTEGMVRLGLLSGAVDELIQSRGYKRYYMHRIGHWLGMDVHDVGAYVEGQASSSAAPRRMVITIEPGLYIPPDDTDCPPRTGGSACASRTTCWSRRADPEVLTASIPKEIVDLEALVGRETLEVA